MLLSSDNPVLMKPRESGRRSSRLTTPEPSGSGYETLDSDSQEDAAQRGQTIQELIFRPSREQNVESRALSYDRTLARRDSCNQYSPISPRYQESDKQRPSLPPLKTVLANNLSSPRRTPNIYGASAQPSPQEPTYTTATYKPPSLYPNKKQRTDFVLQPVPPFEPSTTFNSPAIRSTAFESKSGSASTSSSVRYDGSQIHPRSPEARRELSQSRGNLGEPRNRPPEPPYQSHPCSPASDSRGAFDPGLAQRYRVAESMQLPQPDSRDSRCVQRSNDEVQRYLSHNARESRMEQPYHRKLSMNGYNGHRSQDFEGNYDPSYHQYGSKHDIPVRAGFVERDTGSQYGREDHYTVQQSSAFQAGPCQNGQPAFFMPSHYEYQHGKSRKRSNLPKQSTEIMKNWFDQNISNPYPSEEQKAVFSNATGISMTQVSNWFINHRRRCPELREKRDKTRGRECEL